MNAKSYYYLSLVLSAGLLGAGFLLVQAPAGLLAAAALGGLCWLGRQRAIGWLHGLSLAGTVLLAAAGQLAGLPPLLAAAGLTLALATWDLDGYLRRTAGLAAEPALANLEKRHLQHLGPVSGAGLLLAALAVLVRFQLSFWWLFALGLVLIISLSQVIYILRE